MNELEFEHRVTAVEEKCDENATRLTELEHRQDNLDALASSVAVMASEQEHIKTDVTEIKSDVKAIAAKPGKRWDEVVRNVLILVVGALIGFVIKQIGL